MKHTIYYHLNQPEAADAVRVTHFNENADILDGALHRLATEKADAAAVQSSFDLHTGNRLNPHGVTAAQSGAVPAAAKGAPGGVATLSADGLVPVSQLPLPRKNMLHNWHFPAPVNQRGQTGYTTGYAIDRWRINGAGVTATLANGELVVSAPAFERIQQHLEVPERLSSQTITASMLVRNPNGTVRILIHNSTKSVGVTVDAPASSTYQVVKATGKLDISPGDVVFVGLYPGANDAATPRTAYFKAAKLELGNTQTLARQDADGNWVLLDPPPDYGTELAKCQRHCFATGSVDVRVSYINANYLTFYLPIPTSMRVSPVLASGTMEVKAVTGAIQTGFSSAITAMPGVVRINMSKTAHGMSDAMLYIANSIFSADL